MLLLGIAYVVPGLVGHDPWKPNEAYSFGIIYHIWSGGDWVVPMLAGEPFMEKPPLFYISAAYVAKLFSAWLPLHDAARLTSGIFAAVTLVLVGLSARATWGEGRGLVAVTVFLGCIGVLVDSHLIYTDIALLAGLALSFYGLVLSRTRPALAGLALGTGVGIGFMSKGLIAPGLVGCVAVSLPALFGAWRRRDYARCLAVALVAAMPWLIIWPYALYQRSPELFMQWLWINNFGRYFGFAHLGAQSEPWYYTLALPWFAWPALPLALWSAWRLGPEGLKQPAVQLPVLAVIVMLAVLGASASAGTQYALPVLVPLSVIAAGSANLLPQRVATILDWLCRAVFGLLALALWWGWVEMILQGHPPEWSWLASYLPMDFKPTFQGFAFAAAVALTLAWVLLLPRLREWEIRPLLSWTAGLTLVWSLLSTLWLPWIDTAKSYRGMFASMQRALPMDYGCLASQNLGEHERAMLQYVTGIISVRREVQSDTRCGFILQQGRAGDQRFPPQGGWQLVWKGNRPGDTSERFSVFGCKSDAGVTGCTHSVLGWLSDRGSNPWRRGYP
jgi:4-amino-4-deoxy-L-arabinose transferase-like glycosyltransferase